MTDGSDMMLRGAEWMEEEGGRRKGRKRRRRRRRRGREWRMQLLSIHAGLFYTRKH